MPDLREGFRWRLSLEMSGVSSSEEVEERGRGALICVLRQSKSKRVFELVYMPGILLEFHSHYLCSFAGGVIIFPIL